MTIVTALLVIAIIVMVHEIGHFVAAKWQGVEVQEFSIGFGPSLIGIKRGETRYSLRLLPLGGFVRMAGMGAQDEDRDNPQGFNRKTPLQKVEVLAAGPGMNFLLAALIFVYTFTFVGIPHAVESPVIGEVIQGKPAYEAGLRAQDRVVSVNGENISTWNEFVAEVRKAEPGQPISMTVVRNGQKIELTVRPEFDREQKTSIIGVRQTIEFERVGIWDGLKLGFYQTFHITWLLLSGLGQLLTGAASSADLAGPVGITRMIGDAAEGGLVYLANFTALLSINLGILNLLPIPALDGSRIVFAVIEGIRRKPVEPERENFIHFLGFVFLMVLILLVTYNDIVRLVRG